MSEFKEKHVDSLSWGETTEPSSHNPAHFRYLVHAINPFSAMNALTITMYDARDGITYDESWGDQKISMYNQPERLGERVSLSMSLIDQDHTATWGDAGLIVEAPESNIVLTSSSDAEAHNDNLLFLFEQARKYGVLSGDSLFQNSSPDCYNEVVALANRDGRKVQLKGFFYKATKAGEPYDKLIANRMKEHALRLGLPVVAITELGYYAQDKVESHDGKLAVQLNGNCYLLDGYEPQHRFRSYDERGYSHFIAPHEIEPVLDYAVDSGGLTELEATKIAANYQEVDRQRQTPKVEFDEDGSVKEISYLTGYGADEARVSLGKGVHGYRTNLAMQAEKMQEAMLSMYEFKMTGFDEDRYYRPLSFHEADEMVRIVCANLDKEKVDIVQKWYSEKRKLLVGYMRDSTNSSLRSRKNLAYLALSDRKAVRNLRYKQRS